MFAQTSINKNKIFFIILNERLFPDDRMIKAIKLIKDANELFRV
jgi:hypothetical protein